MLCLYTSLADRNLRNRKEPEYRAALEAECGELGVMEVPDGMLESEVRHCASHPSALDPSLMPDFAALAEKEAQLAGVGRRSKHGRTSSADRATTDIFGRSTQACWYGSDQYGCKDNSCWTTCGSYGQWCWRAEGNGSGPWIKCSVDAQCSFDIGSCSTGSCAACGCSCS